MPSLVPAESIVLRASTVYLKGRPDCVASSPSPPPCSGSGNRTQARERYRSIAGELRSAERSALMSMRARSEIGDSELRSLEHELDLLDLRASGA